jgi:hypothetical protein
VIGLDKLYVVFAGLEGLVRAGKIEGFVVNWLLMRLIVFCAVLT